MIYKTYSQNLKLNPFTFNIIKLLSSYTAIVYNESINNLNEAKKNHKFLTKSENIKLLHDINKLEYLSENIIAQVCYKAHFAVDLYYKSLKSKRNGLKTHKLNKPGENKSKYFPIIFRPEQNKSKIELPLTNKFIKNSENIKDNNSELNKLEISDKEFLSNFKNKIEFNIPQFLIGKSIKLVTIKPLYKARCFKICYAYESELVLQENNNSNVMAIDLGVNNLATCVTTNYKSFIIDGKKLKSINQFYNKHISFLKANNQYVLKKEFDTNSNKVEYIKYKKSEIKESDDYEWYVTKKILHTNIKRDNKIKDYIYKATNLIIKKALENKVGIIVLGYSKTFQSKGKKTEFKRTDKVFNQRFLFIPFGKIFERLEFLCKLYSIKFIVQEESYTSKASFFDNDDIPNNFHITNKFSGSRIKRGLYETKNKMYVNADVNGALNILKKSRVCSDSIIESIRLIGVGTPMRYQID